MDAKEIKLKKFPSILIDYKIFAPIGIYLAIILLKFRMIKVKLIKHVFIRGY